MGQGWPTHGLQAELQVVAGARGGGRHKGEVLVAGAAQVAAARWRGVARGVNRRPLPRGQDAGVAALELGRRRRPLIAGSAARRLPANTTR